MKTAYEQRQEDRINRLNNRAAALTQKGDEQSDAAWNMNREIPCGQPILVGHHSERRHRNAIAKQDNAIRRSIETKKAAREAIYRAQGAETRNAIDSDDPGAVVKLGERIAELEAQRDTIKANNKKSMKLKGVRMHSSWELSNLGANIRRLKKRAAQLEQLNSAIGTEAHEMNFGRVEFETNPEEGRIFITTPERNDEAYKLLRSRGWVWSRSRSCFTRKLTANALGAAQEIGPMLKAIFAD